MTRSFSKRWIALAAPMLLASQAWSAGYDKTTMWSGRYSGTAGAAASTVTGAEAVYYNPAGLFSKKAVKQLSLNVSPTVTKFSGPAAKDKEVIDSTTGFVPPASLLYAHPLNDRFGLGAGIYTSAGANVEFNDVKYAGYSKLAKHQSKLNVTELAIGAGYLVRDDLKVGAAWRISHATAALASVAAGTTPGPNITNVEINDITGQNFEGFRLGVQYDPAPTWGLGLNYRSETKIRGKGKSQGFTQFVTTTVINHKSEDASLSTLLPMQLVLGGHYDLEPGVWRLFADYTWTQYSRVNAIEIDATLSTGTKVPNVEQRWQDEHAIRVAAEYTKYAWPVRFGYVLSTPVTEERYMRPTFTPPGTGHTLAAGTGLELQDNLRLDGGLQYSFAVADVSQTAQEGTKTGEYAANAFSVNLGATYNF